MPNHNWNGTMYVGSQSFMTSGFLSTSLAGWNTQPQYRNDGHVVLRNAQGFELPYLIVREDAPDVVLPVQGVEFTFMRTNTFDAFGRRIYTEVQPPSPGPPKKAQRAMRLGKEPV